MDPKFKFLVVQLAGIGTILNNTIIFPLGSRWDIFKNNKQWEPISLCDCENRKGKWLCPNLYGILNSPNPGLVYLPQQITTDGIWERGVFVGKG